MSNILIIKHGSLGDLIQANGAIKDIKNKFPEDKVLLLTTPHYSKFMYSCPYIDGVLIDKRLPRWNLFYLFKLKKMLNRFSFSKVFDLQNSSRTNFYRKFIFKNDVFWSGSNSFLSKEELISQCQHPSPPPGKTYPMKFYETLRQHSFQNNLEYTPYIF